MCHSILHMDEVVLGVGQVEMNNSHVFSYVIDYRRDRCGSICSTVISEGESMTVIEHKCIHREECGGRQAGFSS